MLGGWLVEHLRSQGASIVCLVRDWVPQANLVRSGALDLVTVVRGDVCDQSTVERVLGEYEVRSIFHLAAQTIVTIANRNPISTFQSNVAGTWSLLEAARRSPLVEQIIVASSDKAYGEQDQLPYREDAPLKGTHPYDVSKSCADLIAQSYFVTYGLPVAVTRCGNLFGGGDLNWNRIVPGTIRSVFRGERPIIRSDGEYVRDYFYVEDAAAAYALLARKMADDKSLHGQAFNFSNDEPLTVVQIAKKILQVMESGLEPVVQNQASHEIRKQYLSSAKARQLLGWSPLYPLEESLAKTVAWYAALLGVPQAAGAAQ